MNITAKGIGVDAGMIMVADMDYLKKVPSPDYKELERLGKAFDIPNGRYQINWKIDETWNGDIEGREELEVTSGKIFVCDPCYCIGRNGEDWDRWLEDTDFSRDINNEQAFVIDEMGGDGVYTIFITLENI